MKTELKKLIVFGVIITFFTTLYTSFLTIATRKGFTNDFISDWLALLPKTYLLLLPFVLITGRFTHSIVERLFRNQSRPRKYF